MRNKIRLIRLQKNVSISEIATKLRISESMVRKVETGLRTPSVTLAKRWADYLKIPEEEIFRHFFAQNQDSMYHDKTKLI